MYILISSVLFGFAHLAFAGVAVAQYPAPCEIECLSMKKVFSRNDAESIIRKIFNQSDLVLVQLSHNSSTTSYRELGYFASTKQLGQLPHEVLLAPGLTFSAEDLKNPGQERLFFYDQPSDQSSLLPEALESLLISEQQLQDLLASNSSQACFVKVFAFSKDSKLPFFYESEHFDRYLTQSAKISVIDSSRTNRADVHMNNGLKKVSTARQVSEKRLLELRSLGVCRT
jgi:hypothetical protein